MHRKNDVVAEEGQREVMVPLLKRHEVQILRRAGHTPTEVMRMTGISRREVRRIEREDEVRHVDDEIERQRRRIGRPSKAEHYRALIEKLVLEDPPLMSLEILRRAKDAGYAGSKTSLYALIAATRPKDTKPIVRFEGLPGEFSQHDFGEVEVRFIDGKVKRVHFFASRLKYSRWAQVTIVDNQQVETLLRRLLEHLAAFGGVPLLAVFDRPKTIVIQSKPDGTVTQWNSTFAQAMLELGVGVELCFPRSGNQKGSVERIVGWVKNSFFKQRRFVDEQDLREQLAAWHTHINTELASRATGEVPQVRLEEERSRLRPLKVTPSDFALRVPVVVGPTAEVLFEGVRYSMPPKSMHVPATLYLYQDRVRIVAGQHVSEQKRRTKHDPYSAPQEHRAEMIAAVNGKRAKLYYKRQQLFALGSVAAQYLTELVHRRSKTWITDVEKLFDLLQEHGEESLRSALTRGVTEQLFGAEYIAHFLLPLGAPMPVPWEFKVSNNVSGKGSGAHPRGPRGFRNSKRHGRGGTREAIHER